MIESSWTLQSAFCNFTENLFRPSDLQDEFSVTVKNQSESSHVSDSQEQEGADELTVTNSENKDTSQSDVNVQVQLAKINLVREKKWIRQTKLKSQRERHSSSDSAFSVVKWVHYKKWVKDEDLYCTQNYTNFQQFMHAIEVISEKDCFTEVNHYINYKIVKWWEIHKTEKSMKDT